MLYIFIYYELNHLLKGNMQIKKKYITHKTFVLNVYIVFNVSVIFKNWIFYFKNLFIVINLNYHNIKFILNVCHVYYFIHLWELNCLFKGISLKKCNVFTHIKFILNVNIILNFSFIFENFMVYSKELFTEKIQSIKQN